jgi:excisionase family DNA binding protein
MHGEPPNPSILTTDEAAKLLGISERTLRKKSAAGQIPHFKIGNIVRFHLSELRTYKERSGAACKNEIRSRVAASVRAD